MPVALAIGVGLLAMFLVAYGSALVAHNQSTGWLGWLSEQVGSIPLFGPLTIKQAIRLETWITTALKPAFDYADGKIAAFISYLGQISGYHSDQQLRTAVAMFNTAAWANTKLRSEIVTHATASATAAALVKSGKLVPIKKLRDWQANYAAQIELRHIEAVILRKIGHDPAWKNAIAADLPLARPIPGVKGGLTKAEIDEKVRAYVKAALAAAGLALPFPIPGKPVAIPRPQAKINHNTNTRLRRLEKLLGIAGLAGLITATFGGEITRFLRCKNTRGIAKAWCGADLSALLGLLGTAIAIEGNFSIVDMAEGMLAVETQMVKLIGGAFSETKNLV